MAVCSSVQGHAEARPIGENGQAFLGIRVLKAPNSPILPWGAEIRADCVGCKLVTTHHASGQNAKELFFHIWVPRENTAVGPIRLNIDPRKVRGVLASYTDVDLPKRGYRRSEARANGMARIAYRQVADGIVFEVPAALEGVSLPPDELAEVSQHYSYIETPGVYVRIGHPDKQRRRGAYAAGPWPEIEAKAAINLEFAAREAILILGLDSALVKAGVTTIMLMNFDTDYPSLGPDTAHDDWPPHWHMHLFWKDVPKVRKVGHFYLSPAGLLTANNSSDITSFEKLTRSSRWYLPGEADDTRSPDGKLLFSHTITPEGHFILASPSGVCRFAPLAKGFDSGVVLSCDKRSAPLRVRAEDDPDTGRLKLFVDDRLAKDYRYDPDTGVVLTSGARQ